MSDVYTWADEQLSRIEAKLSSVLKRSKGIIPYTAENGRFVDMSGDGTIGAWTNGFWSGVLWLMYSFSGKSEYRAEAIKAEEKLDALFSRYEDLDHDAGFRFLPSSVMHYRDDGDRRARDRALIAAQLLAGRYVLRGRYISAWNNWEKRGIDNRGKMIIDTMMNLPLLWWASDILSDSRFSDIALSHAVSASSALVRPDGSVSHIALFDIETGALLRTEAGQGYAVGSMWTRGQAWGIYGFAEAYKHTGKKAFLEISRRVADSFIKHIPQSGIIPVDFMQPEECGFEDDSAAAAAASALILLSSSLGDEGRLYRETAVRLLDVLLAKCSDFSSETDSILLRCSAKYREEKHGYPIIYGDYYLIEALMRLRGSTFTAW